MSAEERPEGWHLTFADEGRNPLVFSEQARRLIVRTVTRVAGRCLSLFGVVDDHLHVVVLCLRRRAGRLAQALTLALVPFNPRLRASTPRPVEGRQHMESLVPYILKQVWRHQVVGAHPALWSGSCFQDLIGARVLDGLALQIGAALPRFELRTVYRAVGLNIDQLAPLGCEAIRALGAARLVAGASAALCVGPRQGGNTAGVARARRCVAQLAVRVGISLPEVAWALGISPCTARRLSVGPAETAAQRATLRRLSLERSVELL